MGRSREHKLKTMDNVSPPSEEDFIHTPDETDPLWSESFGHWSFSNDSNIGLFTHFQRSQENTDLWRELIIIKYDEDTILVGKSFGLNCDSRNPSANALTIKCLEPFQSWRVSFDGAVRRVKIAELMGGLFTDGIWQPANMTLDCHASAPVWSLSSDQNDGNWAKAHHEQAYRYSGELRFAGQTHMLEGFGLRDHSYGPRNSGASGDAQWFNGQFPSGRCFSITRVANAEGQIFDSAHFVDGGEMIEAEIEDLSPQEHPDPGSAMHVRLRSSSGSCDIRGKFIYRLPVSVMNAAEQVPGKVTDGSHLIYYDSCLRYDWDGEEGTGFANIVFAPK